MRNDAADELGTALHFTRMIRLGLEAMWNAMDALPDDMAPDDGGVLRPVSLVSPPPARALADITAAIGVLDGHALVIARED